MFYFRFLMECADVMYPLNFYIDIWATAGNEAMRRNKARPCCSWCCFKLNYGSCSSERKICLKMQKTMNV